MIVLEESFPFKDDLVTLNRNYFTGILIHEIFYPCLKNTCSKFSSNGFLEGCLAYFQFISQSENFKDILVGLVPNCTKQSGDREFFLTIDVCIHDIVDVSCKFNPGTLERDNPG